MPHRCPHEAWALDASDFTQLAQMLRQEAAHLADLEPDGSELTRAVIRATFTLSQAEAELRNLALAIVDACAQGDAPQSEEPDEEPLQDDARFDAPSFVDQIAQPDAQPEPQVAPPPAKKKRGRPKNKAGR